MARGAMADNQLEQQGACKTIQVVPLEKALSLGALVWSWAEDDHGKRSSWNLAEHG
jgi:hypothetical protein